MSSKKKTVDLSAIVATASSAMVEDFNARKDSYTAGDVVKLGNDEIHDNIFKALGTSLADANKVMDGIFLASAAAIKAAGEIGRSLLSADGSGEQIEYQSEVCRSGDVITASHGGTIFKGREFKVPDGTEEVDGVQVVKYRTETHAGALIGQRFTFQNGKDCEPITKAVMDELRSTYQDAFFGETSSTETESTADVTVA